MTIGLFDSGIGGLTVLQSLKGHLPKEKYIYLGDTARLPYGTKSPETIQRYTQQNIDFLMRKKVDLIISACHSASSAILQFDMRAAVPLFNVIAPSCTKAMNQSRNKRIGLLATQTTVDAGQYNKAVRAPFELYAQASPLLVSLVEAGWIEDAITDQIIQRYVSPLREQNVDVIILGCTHFPLLREGIQRAVGHDVRLIDPGECLAQQVKDMGIPAAPETSLELYLTDNSPHFVAIAEKILGEKNIHTQSIDL